MTEIHAIYAPGAPHGTIMNCKYNAVPLSKRDNHRPRLHARALLCHNEFATREVFVGFRQQYGQLERENVFAVEILVQTVVIIGPVLE